MDAFQTYDEGLQSYRDRFYASLRWFVYSRPVCVWRFMDLLKPNCEKFDWKFKLLLQLAVAHHQKPRPRHVIIMMFKPQRSFWVFDFMHSNITILTQVKLKFEVECTL